MENAPAASTTTNERTDTATMPEESQENDGQSAASDFDIIESSVDHHEGIANLARLEIGTETAKVFFVA